MVPHSHLIAFIYEQKLISEIVINNVLWSQANLQATSLAERNYRVEATARRAAAVSRALDRAASLADGAASAADVVWDSADAAAALLDRARAQYRDLALEHPALHVTNRFNGSQI